MEELKNKAKTKGLTEDDINKIVKKPVYLKVTTDTKVMVENYVNSLLQIELRKKNEQRKKFNSKYTSWWGGKNITVLENLNKFEINELW